MASFFKEFLLEDARRLNPASGQEVLLTAFGKHPAWKDHNGIQIGLNTPSLLLAWDRLYENGIGGKGGPITSEDYSWNKWDEKTPGELLAGFDHTFIWWRSGQFLAGRMWATSDHARPPRRDYPLIACFHAVGIPLIWGIRSLLPYLEAVPAFCLIRDPAEIEATVQQVWNNDAYGETLRKQVQTGFERLQRDLRHAIAQVPPEGFAPPLTPEERKQFVLAPEFAPDQEGLQRVLYQVDSQFSAYLGQKSLAIGEAVGLEPSQIRVPIAAPSAVEGMLRWIEFFQLLLSPGTPILLTAATGADWMDITVGEPTAGDFFRLRASPKAIPVASSTPFTLEPNMREKGARVINAFLSGQRTITQPKTSSSLFQTATSFFRRPAKPPDPPAEPPGQKKFWLFLAVLGLAGLLGIGG
jgi:hypothetical protein